MRKKTLTLALFVEPMLLLTAIGVLAASAEASGLSFEEIMAQRGREEGGGWGYIIKELELDIKRSDTNLGAIRSGRVVTETEPVTGAVQGTDRLDRGPQETPRARSWERDRD